MKLEKSSHAPGSILLIEIQGEIHEAVIVGWSPMGQAVKIMAGQSPMWLATSKAHTIEFLRIVGWDEFNRMMAEAEKAQAQSQETTTSKPEEAKSAEPSA